MRKSVLAECLADADPPSGKPPIDRIERLRMVESDLDDFSEIDDVEDRWETLSDLLTSRK